MTDREQARSDADTALKWMADPPTRKALARHVLSLLSELEAAEEALRYVRAESRQEIGMEDPWGSQGPPILISANSYFELVKALGLESQDEARAALSKPGAGE